MATSNTAKTNRSTTRAKSQKQQVQDSIPDTIITENVSVVNTNKEEIKNKRVMFDDSAIILVKSNTFGHLIYINPRTGDRTDWMHFGDEQPITMGDLRAMRGTQNAFFSDNMIIVTGVNDDRYPDAGPSDVYDALMVSKYYKYLVDPDNFNSLFSMNENEIRERVHSMSQNARMNLVIALNTSIENGSLDSVKKIRLFEELLGCELTDLQ